VGCGLVLVTVTVGMCHLISGVNPFWLLTATVAAVGNSTGLCLPSGHAVCSRCSCPHALAASGLTMPLLLPSEVCWHARARGDPNGWRTTASWAGMAMVLPWHWATASDVLRKTTPSDSPSPVLCTHEPIRLETLSIDATRYAGCFSKQ
jgi:hypothetical protein